MFSSTGGPTEAARNPFGSAIEEASLFSWLFFIFFDQVDDPPFARQKK
jgi:hypothetical protein